MLFKLAFIVFCSSVVVFFAEEWGRFFKKVLSLPGFKLLLPLVIASCFIEFYDIWGEWLLLKIQSGFHLAIHTISNLLPFTQGAVFLTRILFLLGLASLPLCFYQLRAKQKKRPHLEPVSYWLGLTIWIIAALLLTVAL
jgi:hypothetical protein